MFVFGHSEVVKEAGDFGKGRNPHPRTEGIYFLLVLGKRQVNVLPTCMEETIRACPDRLTLPQVLSIFEFAPAVLGCCIQSGSGGLRCGAIPAAQHRIASRIIDQVPKQ